MLELENRKRHMQMILARKVEFARERLSHYETRLRYLSPKNRLNENRRILMDLEECLERAMKEKLNEKRQRLLYLSQQLEVYSPLKKLQQGFSYVEDRTHKAIKSIEQVETGDKVTIHVLDGENEATESEVRENER